MIREYFVGEKEPFQMFSRCNSSEQTIEFQVDFWYLHWSDIYGKPRK